MKKLSKLVINPEKVMKNEELMLLRGGTNPCDGMNGTCGFMCYQPGSWGTAEGGCCMEQGFMEETMQPYLSAGWSCNWCCDSCNISSYCNDWY